MPDFLTGLKRRNVFREAAAYTVVAWAIAQAIDMAADSFDTPGWVMKITLVILIMGSPIWAQQFPCGRPTSWTDETGNSHRS